jgi:2-phospho-L-lactate transferase/gluconeogenesis factor (CofD/UPF0052 family)
MLWSKMRARILSIKNILTMMVKYVKDISMKTVIKLMASSGFSKKTALMINSVLKESRKIRETKRKMQSIMMKKQRMKKKKMRKTLMEWKKS